MKKNKNKMLFKILCVVIAGITLNIANSAAGGSQIHDATANTELGVDYIQEEMNITGNGVIVAIIDSGIDPDHIEFSGRILTGYNFLDESSNTSDDLGHGTKMAGIVGARGMGGLEYSAIVPGGKGNLSIGVAPSVYFYPLKILNSSINRTSKMARAIRFAVDGGADEILMSLGITEKLFEGYCDEAFPDVTEAVNYAFQKNVIIVAAAGNAGEEGVASPACLASVLGVGNMLDATALTISSQSGVGEGVDIVAPGGYLYTAFPSNAYTMSTGTSASAAYTAGVVALMLEANRQAAQIGAPKLTAVQIQDVLQNTALDIDPPFRDNKTGYGMINPVAAVRSVCLPTVLKEYDRNGNCRIAKSEAINVVNDFFDGKISRESAISAVKAYYL